MGGIEVGSSPEQMLHHADVIQWVATHWGRPQSWFYKVGSRGCLHRAIILPREVAVPDQTRVPDREGLSPGRVVEVDPRATRVEG